MDTEQRRSPGVQGVAETDLHTAEAKALDASADRLAQAFSNVSRDEIARLLRHAHARTADARVQAFRLLLAEGAVYSQLLHEPPSVGAGSTSDYIADTLRLARQAS
jgi:hypothetical protein